MQTWNEVLSWLHFAVKSCLLTKKVDDSLISCSEVLTLGVFPQTAVRLFKMLTIHFFKIFFLTMTTFETQPSGQNICSQVASNGSPLCGKKVVFFVCCFALCFMVLEGNENKWAQQERAAHSLLWTTTAFVYLFEWGTYCHLIFSH